MSEKIKEKRIFNKKLLDECLTRDGAILIGEYNEVLMTTIITYKCKCGVEFAKKMNTLRYKTGGALCKACTKKGRNEKVKATCLKRFGVENPNQNKEILAKTKATNIKKYGVEFSLQNKDVQEKIKATNLEKYGSENPFQSELCKEKIKATNLEKYGAENPNHNKEIRDKIKATCLKRFGVENPNQNKEIQDKSNNTNLERLGVKYPTQSKEVMNKVKATNIERYGVEWSLQSQEVKDKSKATNLVRYGYEYPIQNLEIQAKQEQNSKKYKEYKMPSGIIRKVQGYEPFALDELVKKYTDEQLKTDRKDVPRVEYTIEEKKHFYFPDIFIPHENKIIEVKSTWTFNKKNDITMAKAKCCKEKGYNFELWVYDGKGGKQIITV